MIQPERTSAGRGEVAGIVILAVALTVYFTWPLALHPAGIGRVALGDGQFSIWNVAWVAHALTTGADLFDANIFYPHQGTLAYSEPNIGAGLLAVPAYALTGNPYLAHNSAVLIALAASVITMYALARRLTGSIEASLVAAITYTFCPFLFARTAHVQLMMIAPLPLSLLAFHRFADETTAVRAVVLGVALGVQALFCSYYGVLAGLLVGLGVLVFALIDGRWRQPRWWLLTALAAAIAVLSVSPVLWKYIELQKESGFTRTVEEAGRYSADWRAYLASSAWAHRWILPYLGHWNEVLFPGITATVGGLAGAVLSIRRLRESRTQFGVTLFYLLVLILAFWSSFGPGAGLYRWLYHAVPVLSLLRAPARFGLAVTLALSVFVAIGLTTLLARVPSGARRWCAAAIALFAIVELTTHIPFLPARDVPEPYRILAASPHGAVVEFPFYHLPEDRFRHTLYMLGSTWHWQPLVNGYSDFFPPDFIEGAPLLGSFPSPQGFAWLEQRRARYLVFHTNLYDPASREVLRRQIAEHSQFLQPRYVEGSVLLYEIVAWPRASP
jgi:4-amino-4-deoxy-L-arabinose transferase-like glycosyltransferase